MNSTADMLRQLRESTGLNQKDFAASVGMKQTTYNGYETGKHRPKSDVLIAIANKYNVSVDYLLGLPDEKKENEHYGSLNDLYYQGVQSWINKGFFSADEKTMLKAHFSGVLNQYKELVEETSRAKRTLKLYLKAIEPFNNERSSPLTTQELAEQFLKQELERVTDGLKHYIDVFTFHFAKTVADENLAGQTPSGVEGQESERWEVEEYRKQLLKQQAEMEQQKTPTPVSESGLDEDMEEKSLESFIKKYEKDLTAGQMQQIVGMMQAMIAPRKQPLSVSVQQTADEKSPKTELPDRS